MTALVEWLNRLVDRVALALAILAMGVVRWATEIKPGTEAAA